jgi:CheY-like chemotaxis protein
MSKLLLIVEDNAVSREGMAVILRKEGYEVVAFPDGQAALNYLTNNPAPDLILLDMIIPPPGCDGWRFLQQRNRLPGLASIPVIVTTGLGIASIEWAASLGAYGLLHKPIEVEPLLAEVRRCLADRCLPS